MATIPDDTPAVYLDGRAVFMQALKQERTDVNGRLAHVRSLRMPQDWQLGWASPERHQNKLRGREMALLYATGWWRTPQSRTTPLPEGENS